MTPVRPPATKMASAPVTNSMGTEKITRPSSMVAMKAKICTPVGIATASEAAEKKPSEIDRKSVGQGKRVSVRIDLGRRQIIKKKRQSRTRTVSIYTKAAYESP